MNKIITILLALAFSASAVASTATPSNKDADKKAAPVMVGQPVDDKAAAGSMDSTQDGEGDNDNQKSDEKKDDTKK